MKEKERKSGGVIRLCVTFLHTAILAADFDAGIRLNARSHTCTGQRQTSAVGILIIQHVPFTLNTQILFR